MNYLLRVCLPNWNCCNLRPALDTLHTIGIKVQKMTTAASSSDTPLIPVAEAKRFVFDCLKALGTPATHAEIAASIIIEADHRGHFSHGMNRLEMYLNEVQEGLTDCAAVPAILNQTAATAWVDGGNGFGFVVGKFCMELAIKKAKAVGVGFVSAKGSNHYGIAGSYAMDAQKQGLLGLSFTNSSPLVSPTRAKQAAIGTNPIALAAPGCGSDRFVLDMATSAAALGKIEIQKRKNEPIPEGWALDKTGEMTTDPFTAYDAACLMPLGGDEAHSGFKGYGLGMLVEIFCGILAGANYGPYIRKWGDHSRLADLGQCFIAVNPNCFAPGFEERLSDMLKYLRQMEPMDPAQPVLALGDPEEQHIKLVNEAGGIRYLPNQLETCRKLAKRFNVKPLTPAR